MIALIYVDAVLFFGSNQDTIDVFIKGLEYSSTLLTVEEYVYDFFGVGVDTDNKSSKVTLAHGGLKKKVLKTVGMLDSNKEITP